jgi:dTDP-4-amino-4,6-dideoxygalactose transaminase
VKRTLAELAVFGGAPAFPEPLHVGRPNIGDRQRLLDRLTDILDRRWLTNNGVYVQEFEAKIAALVGVKHCIAICNATIALELTIMALGLSGEVIVPSFTFVATCHALRWRQITPMFCDVEPGRHTLDPGSVRRRITPRTTGILGVHVWGGACDVDGLTAIAREHDLKLVFDAAHAFGGSYRGRMIGQFGDAEVFSFHATKFLNSFEGGAVVTNDDALAHRIRLMKNFGFSGYDTVVQLGTNGKMSEVSAAMGLTSLECMDEFIAVNRRHHEQYQAELAGIPGLRLLTYDEHERANYQSDVLEIDETQTMISRDMLVTLLARENVLARRYFYPGCHRMEPYRTDDPRAGLVLPTTERLVERVLTLPTGTAIGKAEIGEVCQIIRLALAHGSEVSRRVAPTR